MVALYGDVPNEERAKRGVFVLIKATIKNKIINNEIINEKVSTVNIKLKIISR